MRSLATGFEVDNVMQSDNLRQGAICFRFDEEVD